MSTNTFSKTVKKRLLIIHDGACDNTSDPIFQLSINYP